jgi:hypothetical protein
MKVLRPLLLVCALGIASVSTSTDAGASVSIAVSLDALVKDADAVAVSTPLDAKSVWEDGRIYTYTKLKVEQGVAGDLATGSETWVRTMGGVVGKIGQLVDGEPVFATGKSSVVFLHKFRQSGIWEVSARSQGQYPIIQDESTHTKKLIRSANVGVLLPAKAPAAAPVVGPVAPQAQGQTPIQGEAKPLVATDVLHERALDDALREIATSWKRLHPAAK